MLAPRMNTLSHVKALHFAVLYCPPSGGQPDREILGKGHERCELVISGRGWVETGPGWTEVTAGSLVWNVGGDLTIGRNDLANPFRCLAVDFLVSPRRRRPAPRFTRWEDSDEREAFVRQVSRLSVQSDHDRPALGAFIYTAMLLQTRIWQQRDHQPAVPSQVRRAAALIDGSYQDDLDIPALADAVGWSPSHLHAAFRRHLGTSPHQYLIRRRVQAVREALRQRDQGLAEIALACGFPDSRTLIRSFRRHMGISPARWRARLRDG